MYSRSRVAGQVFGMTFGFIALGALMAFSFQFIPQEIILGAILLYGIGMMLLNFVIKPPAQYRNQLLKLEDEKWIESIAMYALMGLLGLLLVMTLGSLWSSSNIVFFFGMYLGFLISLLSSVCFLIGRIALGRKGFPHPAFTGSAARAVAIFAGLSGSAIFALCLSFLLGR